MENNPTEKSQQNQEQFVEFAVVKLYWDNHREMCISILSLLKRGESPKKIYHYFIEKLGSNFTTENIGILTNYFDQLLKRKRT